MKAWALTACVWLLFVGSVQAGPSADPRGGGQWRWWDNPEVRRAVGLTDEQVKRIRQILRSHREAMIDVRSALEKKGIVLRDEVERDDFDLQRSLRAGEDFQRARREVEEARLRLLLEIRGVLSREQFLKLRELQEQARRQRWERLRQGSGRPQ